MGIIQNFFCDVNRSVLALLKYTAYILTDDADAEQLDTAEDQDQCDDGGITGYINAPEQFFKDHPDQIQDRGNAGDGTQDGCQTQRCGGVTDDAFNGIIDQLEEAPFCGAGGPLTGGVGNEMGIVANPGKDTLAETVVFRKIQNTVPDTAAEGAEVTGIGLDLDRGELVDDGVEALIEE